MFQKKHVFRAPKSSFFVPFFVSFFAQKFSKKKCFSLKLFGILLFRKSKYAATINSQVKIFLFFFWNFLSNNIKNVNLKYKNLKEDEHFYFIQSQQNFTSFFLKIAHTKFLKQGPLCFLKLRSLFLSLQMHANCLKLI